MVRKRLLAAVIVIATSVILSASLHAEEQFKRLNGQQIRAKFAGMELTDQSHWGEVFEPNGTLKSFGWDIGRSGSGEFRKISSALIEEARWLAVVTRYGLRARRWS
jgi:hypothetical protein